MGNPSCFDEDNIMLFMIGVLCGLAIYNYTIINLPFPLAIYKKMLNKMSEASKTSKACPQHWQKGSVIFSLMNKTTLKKCFALILLSLKTFSVRLKPKS